jgi:von Willebrand factor type A domain
MKRAIAILFWSALAAAGATKVIVTVVESRSGRPVTDIKAGEFSVMDDKTPLRVEGAEFSSGLIDVMLLLDTSLVGEMVQPVASSLVAQLQEKEQMAVVSFHTSADLIQDFTSSRELLSRAIASVKYGNAPLVLDALYAAIDGGFEHSSFRRVILLLTAGYEGRGRVSEREVFRLARKNGVSIYPVYVAGSGRWLFEILARQTGGASFNLRDMQRSGGGGPSGASPGARIFDVLRAHYTLTLTGNLALGEKLKIEVKRPEKLFVSALPVE